MSTTSGRELARQRDRLAAVAGLADDLDVGLGAQDHAEAGADEALVVGEQDADHRAGRAAAGRAARIRRSGCRAGLELSAVDADALADADEPVSGAAAVAVARAVVDDLELELVGAVAHDHVARAQGRRA